MRAGYIKLKKAFDTLHHRVSSKSFGIEWLGPLFVCFISERIYYFKVYCDYTLHVFQHFYSKVKRWFGICKCFFCLLSFSLCLSRCEQNFHTEFIWLTRCILSGIIASTYVRLQLPFFGSRGWVLWRLCFTNLEVTKINVTRCMHLGVEVMLVSGILEYWGNLTLS